MSFYEKHIFFCVNQKANNKKCCNEVNAEEICAYTKSLLKDLQLHGNGKYRVSSSGCMGLCSKGPVMVIYPEGIWYSYQTKGDIDEIIKSHLINGIIFDKLQLKN